MGLCLVSRRKLHPNCPEPQSALSSRVFKVSARQEIGANHLQAISSRFVSAKHESNRVQGLLDDRQLTLIKLEIDDLPRLGFLPCKMPFHLSFELLPGELVGLVHPGCTSELGSISACYLDELPRLGPAHDSKLRFRHAGQMFVNGHEVIGLATRFGKALRQKFVKRVQLF